MALTHAKKNDPNGAMTAPKTRRRAARKAATAPKVSDKQVRAMLTVAVKLARRAGRAETTLKWVAGARNAPLSAKADAMSNLLQAATAKKAAKDLSADISSKQGSPATWQPRLTVLETKVKMSEAIANNLNRIVTGARMQNANDANDAIESAENVRTGLVAASAIATAPLAPGWSVAYGAGLAGLGSLSEQACDGEGKVDAGTVVLAAGLGGLKSGVASYVGNKIPADKVLDGDSVTAMIGLADTAIGGGGKKKR